MRYIQKLYSYDLREVVIKGDGLTNLSPFAGIRPSDYNIP